MTVSLAEELAELAEQYADLPPGPGRAEVAGRLGGCHLDRYDAHGDPESLAEGIALIEEAVASSPNHPNALGWQFTLAVGYAARAWRHHDAADFGRSLSLLEVILDVLPPGDPDRDLAAIVAVDAHWDRFQLERARGSRGPAEQPAAAERTAADLARIVADISDDEMSGYGRLVHGRAVLSVFDETERPDDLDIAITVLGGALGAVSPRTPDYAAASAELCLALRVRAFGDPRAEAAEAAGAGPDRADLDRAVEVGERAADACEVDDPDAAMLFGLLAGAYQERWDADGRASDLDRAIACWGEALARGEAGPTAAALCGYLLSRRAEHAGDEDDADNAVRLLEQAVAQPGDEWDAVARRYDLGQAYHVQWRINRTPGSAQRAADCMDLLVAMDPPDERLLAVHNMRLLVAYDLIQEEQRLAPAGQPPPAAGSAARRLAEARAAWDRAPSTEFRTMAAAVLATMELYLGSFDMDTVDLQRLAGLVEIARTLTDRPPDWGQMMDVLGALVDHAKDLQRPAQREDTAFEQLARVAAVPDKDREVDRLLRTLMPVMLHARAADTGDSRSLTAACRRYAEVDTDDPALVGDGFPLMGRVLALAERVRRGDHAGAADEADLLDTQLEQLEADGSPHFVRPMLQGLQEVLAGLTGRPVAKRPPRRPVPRTPPTGLGGYLELHSALMESFGPIATAAQRGDVRELRVHAARVGELAELAPAGHLIRLLGAQLSGLAELEVARLDRTDRAAARRAVRWGAEAAELAGGPGHTLWPYLAMAYGEALRLADDPDRARSRQLGLSALRAQAAQVMIQSGADDAMAAATMAAADAATVARWCREDTAGTDLIAALEAGRGLVLRAATTSRGVVDRLVAAGRPDLAAQWRDSAGYGRDAVTGRPLGSLAGTTEVPDDLRRRVLRVLDADVPGAAAGEVGPDKIRTALTAVGADALVYLMPDSATQPGMAVILPAVGPLAGLELPGLAVGPHSPIGRHVAAGGRYRDAGPAATAQPYRPSTTPSVDDMCRWAWRAAIGDLLGHVQEWELGRPARLVLVPIGKLALVPWHGAFREDAGGRHYAVRQAVFSYTVAARTLYAAATTPARNRRSALIVGDPGGDLPFAGAEARAIRDAFYPEAAYLGNPDGTGTPDEVMDWITNTGAGPSVLHFACHSVTDPADPLHGRLVLAGGALTARQLLEASRLAELVIDRVFLAACTTSLTGAQHDEAFSLSTVFLAAGAGTVFGSLWPVPDAETSLLMYLLHHFLNVESCLPADALHRAQLWMLDPARRAPTGMPPDLARHCRDPRIAEPASWAAFTHLGR